ncbi:MAG: hypothetical protein E6I27_03320 [Chloroflexi bacterium]|nr:MAG: hypothetical protein E6I96_08815 [Chloroflexota bacterium]TMF39323.1 MAG: hypothetical protein E6I27_03320 [Chloroflexota bacterium]
MWNRNPSIFWGGALVIVGVLFLLANLGVLNNINWDVVWPVLLIALGVWLIVARVGPGGASADVDSAEPRDGLEKAKLEVAVGAGRLEVRSAALDEQLYRVHIDHAGAPPEIRLDRGTGTVRISQRVDWFMGARRLHIDARLADAIPWEVSCSTGAIRGDFDLSSAALTGFTCRTGASQVSMALGAPKGTVPVRVEGGALTVHVTRPVGAAIQVQASGGAVQLRTDGARQDGLGTRSWRSEGYDAAPDRYDVTVSGGALNVDITSR